MIAKFCDHPYLLDGTTVAGQVGQCVDTQLKDVRQVYLRQIVLAAAHGSSKVIGINQGSP